MSTASKSRLRGRAEGAGNDHRAPHPSCDGGRLADDEGTAICMRGAPQICTSWTANVGSEGRKGRKKPTPRSKASLVTKSEVCHTPTLLDWVSKGAAAIVREGGRCWSHIFQRRWISESCFALSQQFKNRTETRHLSAALFFPSSESKCLSTKRKRALPTACKGLSMRSQTWLVGTVRSVSPLLSMAAVRHRCSVVLLYSRFVWDSTTLLRGIVSQFWVF